MTQISIFKDDIEYRPKINPKNKDLIKSVSFSQHEILIWIQKIYNIAKFDIDITYSKGRFYRNGVPEPRFKSDLNPQARGVMAVNATHLPFKPDSFKSVIFDPPFFAGGGRSGDLKYKYGSFESVHDLWYVYRSAMIEIKRVLKPYGFMIFKCQDFINGRQQFLIHSDIITFAKSLNFYPRDIFIKLAPHVAIGWNHRGKQDHARKYHCYFIVFEKKIRPVRKLS